MTRDGRSRCFAAAVSLALHAGVLAFALPGTGTAPQPPAGTPMQVSLLAPSIRPPARAASPSQGEGTPAAGSSVLREVETGTPGHLSGPATPATPAAAPGVRETGDAKPASDAPFGTPLADALSDPATGTAPAGASSVPEEDAPATPPYTNGQVLASLKEAFSAHFYYPPLARRKGWQGEVTLALRVETDGRLTGIHVVGSSGYRVLDNAAVDSLSRARALPLPGGALGNELDMLLPVQYRLLDARV